MRLRPKENCEPEATYYEAEAKDFTNYKNTIY